MDQLTNMSVFPFSIHKPNGKQSTPNPYSQIMKLEFENNHHVIIMINYGVPFIVLEKVGDHLQKIRINVNENLWKYQTPFKYATYFMTRYVPGYHINESVITNLKRNLAPTTYFNMDNHGYFYESFNYADANPYEK